MYFKIEGVTEYLKRRYDIDSNEYEVLKESVSEVSLLQKKCKRVIKIIDVDNVSERMLRCIEDLCSSLSDFRFCCVIRCEISMDDVYKYMLIEREYYVRDLEELLQINSLSCKSDICDVLCGLCDILMILSEYNIVVSNLKSSNIIYEEDGDNIKLCDLFIDSLRNEDEMRLYDICFKSPEELNGYECDDKSVIWSIGCILYEMINKRLPFNEDNNMDKTKENIVRCKYSIDAECDEIIKEMIFRMLKVKIEDRWSLKELKKEMIKMGEIIRDNENNLMLCKERKDVLFNNDYLIEISSFNVKAEYYLKSEKRENIRDDLIDFYINKPNEIIVSILLMMKIYKEDYVIIDKLKYGIEHKCKNNEKECLLDELIFHIYVYNEILTVDSKCICLCEDGMNYLFKVLKLMNLTKLKFNDCNIPIQHQPLFGMFFSQLSNLQQLYLNSCYLTFDFIESFIKSIPVMKLEYINLSTNRIGIKGFKLLLPYLHLLINKNNELDLYDMNLNDESMILLAEELYKYPNLQKIDITENLNISSKGLKSLFSKFPITEVDFNFKGSKELLIDKDIPELIKFIKTINSLYLNDLEINDDIFKSFISLRLNELREIKKIDLSNNKLTYKSIEILINNLSSFQCLKELQLNGNKIGDLGMKILLPYCRLLLEYNDYEDYDNKINCTNMGLSSIGLRHLLNGLKNVEEKIEMLDLSDNNIDSSGIDYLMNYVKENDNIRRIVIHDNPIGNAGFKLLQNNLNMLKDEYYPYEMNLSNTSIDDESVELLTKMSDSIEVLYRVNLNGNSITMNGLKSICLKSLIGDKYPFIKVKSTSWTNEELEYYLDYCIKKKRRYFNERKYDLSNLNINDSHISLINQIYYKAIDLSNNKITSKGLRELMDCISSKAKYVSINNNNIGDEGMEIICSNIDYFIDYYPSLNLSKLE